MKHDFEVLGVTLSYDFSDADDTEVMENALEKAQAEVNLLKSDTTLRGSKQIRALCKPFHDMFGALFGEEAVQNIFRGKDNYEDCLQATDELTNAINANNANILNRYSRKPQGNQGGMKGRPYGVMGSHGKRNHK